MILTPVRPIPADELARRICAAHHPHLRTVGASIPCGAHLQAARNVYGLITEAGTLTFDVVVQARNEAGMPTLVSTLGDTDAEPVVIDERTNVEGGCDDCGPGSLDPNGSSGERLACANCDRVF